MGWLVFTSLMMLTISRHMRPNCRRARKRTRYSDASWTGGSLALPDSAGQLAPGLASPIRNVFVHRGASSGESSPPMKLIAVAKR
jgi:hypothetical protein